MSDDDPLKDAKTATVVIGEVIRAAGDDPQAKEAASNLGAAAVTVTAALKNVLLPLAAVNFGFEKARAYFSGKFQEDMAEKTERIPPEHVAEPKASIAGPALQGLAFAHEEAALKDMYLNLLATAMDDRTASEAHPAFVEIIKQMEGNEARMVGFVIGALGSVPIVRIWGQNNDESRKLLARHVVNLHGDEGEPIENPMIPSMVDNWVRLGLVEVSYGSGSTLSFPNAYAWAEQRPEFLWLSEAMPPDVINVYCENGFMQRTSLGKRFAAAIGVNDIEPERPKGG